MNNNGYVLTRSSVKKEKRKKCFLFQSTCWLLFGWFYLFYIQMPSRLGLPAHPPLHVMSFLLDPGGREDLVSTPTHTGAFLHPLFWQIKNSSNPKVTPKGARQSRPWGPHPGQWFPRSAWLPPDSALTWRGFSAIGNSGFKWHQQHAAEGNILLLTSLPYFNLSHTDFSPNKNYMQMDRGFPVKIQLLFKENAEPKDIPLVIY